jgi:putative amidase, phage associated|nr:MAG TPA: Endolysin [Caudoviricetes sp.]
MNSKIDEWFKNAIGRGMNPDGAYGYQCKDVADDYCIHLFGNWQNTIRPADAKNAFNNANDEFFIKIANDLNNSNLIPQRGDIVVWGASQANPYGHIAVVESADTTGVNVIEQDGFTNTTPAYQAKRGYVYAGMPCIGWLRPRPEKIIGYTSPTPVVAGNERVLAVKANARDEANTSAGIFQTIPAGFKVAMKGYITNGQAIDGDTVWFVTARSNKYMSRQVFEDKDLHDLPDLTPQPAPEPVEPAPAPIPEPQPVPETPKKPENTTSVDTHQTLPKAPQVAESQKTGDEPSNDVNKQEKKENVMKYDDNAINKLNETTIQHNQLANDVTEYDEVKKLVGGIDKRVKLAVYIIGDLLIGVGLILPNIAVAFNFGSLQQIQALSSACATAGAFVLTMFGIYKSGKNK